MSGPGKGMAMALMACGLQAQVLVLPHSSTLLEGRSCQFRVARGGEARAQEPGAAGWLWSLGDGGVGSIDPMDGSYQAPAVDKPRLVKVRATSRDCPGRFGEASLVVLPHQPFDTVDKVLGPGWLQPFSSALPFLNSATGKRYDETAAVTVQGTGWQAPAGVHYGGYGIPVSLGWKPAAGAEGQLLSLGMGDDQHQWDVSGQHSQLVSVRGPARGFQVEALWRSPGRPGAWESHTQKASIHLLGLVPYLGNPAMDAGDEDGCGMAARFREPFGLARIPGDSGSGSLNKGGCLVTDSRSHVIRMVSEDGVVTTPWGRAGQAGHLDTLEPLLKRMARGLGAGCLLDEPSRRSLFNRPTFLEVGLKGQLSRNPGWQYCMVSDSGNHVIRVLRPDGSVATHAGSPGRPGHRDSSWGSGARFNNPQGLAEDFAGNLYVADQGNRVIRCVSAEGWVRTLAGCPGQAGHQDGAGAAARFTDLRGLAIFGSVFHPYALYAVDGHAIRRISFTGEVSTVLGVVAAPGFQDFPGATGVEQPQPHLQPCLREPCGLSASVTGLVIADQGNNSVRNWYASDHALTTLVGDPERAEIRWGLPRNGLEAPLDGRYATLAAPRTLMATGPNPERLIVATGACLAELVHAPELRDRVALAELDCSPAERDQPCVCRFRVATTAPSGALTGREIHYVVDYLEADGSLAERRRGSGPAQAAFSVQGVFCQAGTGTVVVRCVTDQGVSVGGRRQLEVP